MLRGIGRFGTWESPTLGNLVEVGRLSGFYTKDVSRGIDYDGTWESL